MLRKVLAALLGYVTMAVLVMAAFSVAFLDPGFAFFKDGITVKTDFLIFVTVMSFLAAMAGGWVACRKGGMHAALGLALFATVFGFIEAARNARRPVPNLAPEEIAKLDLPGKLKIAVQPNAYAAALPLLGAAGIMTGAWLAGRRNASQRLNPPPDARHSR
ncbi:MAG TPA: hypothetical protein VNC50_02095 [Planctomycetia bacterium]|nr:hypothetical protein [Planctomycetia bacterium]